VLTAQVFDAAGIRALDPTDISDAIDRPDRVVWVDLTDAGDDDLARLREEFALHPLAVEDVLERRQRPKLETYPDHVFIVAYGGVDDPLDLPEVNVFVGSNWLVTVREANRAGRRFPVEGVLRRFERLHGERPTVGFLLYVLLDGLVDEHFHILDRVEGDLDRIERRALESGNGGGGRDRSAADRALQEDILHLRRELIILRRRVVPLRDVVTSILRDEVPWISSEERVWFQDVLDHLLRIADTVDSQRELLGNAVDAHLAMVSNRVNEIMKKMTSWGAILLGATLIAGIYGMNFDEMPELGWRFGYPGALGMMVVLTLGLFTYFKRRGWL
jgi:magnesium transporter